MYAIRSYYDVVYRGADKAGVRHGDLRIVKRANPCRPEADFFDAAFEIADLDPVADFKRLVEHHRQGTEEVLDGVLCSKGES